MSESRTELSRRRLLGGLLTVGAAGAAPDAVVMTYFSDSESSAGNAIQAGILNLKLDCTSEPRTSLDVSGIKPGDSSARSVAPGNAGPIPFVPEFTVSNITSSENCLKGTENNRDSGPDSSTHQWTLTWN